MLVHPRYVFRAAEPSEVDPAKLAEIEREQQRLCWDEIARVEARVVAVDPVVLDLELDRYLFDADVRDANVKAGQQRVQGAVRRYFSAA